MEQAFTAAPWHLQDNRIYDVNGVTIAYTNRSPSQRTGEESAANARLICSAPALLAALLKAEEAINIELKAFVKVGGNEGDGATVRAYRLQAVVVEIEQTLAKLNRLPVTDPSD